MRTRSSGTTVAQLTVCSKLSSAHVYLRQSEGEPHGAWDALPAALINDAAQLVKANSIEGALSSEERRGCTPLAGVFCMHEMDS